MRLHHDNKRYCFADCLLRTDARPESRQSRPPNRTRPKASPSLAATVEADTESLAAAPVSFAPTSGKTDAEKAVAKAIPDEAVEVAMAKPEKVAPVKGGARERDCLMRAMYFEFNRSSRDGLLAVGTVVMHRVAAGNWGKSVCGVVGAHRQFAPGVMSRRMQGDTIGSARNWPMPFSPASAIRNLRKT